MRIVQLVCSHGYSGVERYMAALARGLQARGFESIVIGGDESAMQCSLDASGVQFLPGSNMSEALRSLYTVGDVDIINTHMTQADLVGVVGRVRNRARIVSTLHFAHTRGRSVPLRLALRWMSRKYSAQIAISDFVKRMSGEPASVILSGVASRPMNQIQRELMVLLAQRLEPEKRTDFALHAWRQCRARTQGWRLEVAGRGVQAAALSSLAKQLGVADSVDFLGFRSDIHELFERVSILLAPASAEPLGLSVMEAMAAGLPVVASASGGHLETVGAVERRSLFDPVDPAEAAARIDRLAFDKSERDRYGNALRRYQEVHLNIERQIDQIASLYHQLAAETS